MSHHFKPNLKNLIISKLYTSWSQLVDQFNKILYSTIMIEGNGSEGDSGAPKPGTKKGPRARSSVVGQYIRHRREHLNLSQRSLGQLFEPHVTTQFISNVERGVTPLPPSHVATLARALQISEESLLEVLEKEYALKLSGRMGKELPGQTPSLQSKTQLSINSRDFSFMHALYDAYQRADESNKKAFLTVCESLFKLPKSNNN